MVKKFILKFGLGEYDSEKYTQEKWLEIFNNKDKGTRFYVEYLENFFEDAKYLFLYGCERYQFETGKSFNDNKVGPPGTKDWNTANGDDDDLY